MLSLINLGSVIIFIVLLVLFIIYTVLLLYSHREEVKEWSFGEMSLFLAGLALSVIVLLFLAIVLSILPKAIYAGFKKLVF